MKSIAMIGCRHPHWHDYAARIQATPGVRLSHLLDSDTPALTDALASTGTARLDSVQQAEEMAALLLLGETGRHLADVRHWLAGHLPLFIEKPLATEREDLNALTTALHAARIPFHSGFFLRMEPALIAARRLIVGGKLGHVHYVRVRFSHDGARSGWLRDGWLVDPELAGFGGFGDLAIHAVDLMQWWGLAPLTAQRAMLCHVLGETPGDDFGAGWLRHPKGLAIIEAGWAAGDWPMLDIELLGSLGALRTCGHELKVHFKDTYHSETLGTLRPDAGLGLDPFLHGLVSGDWSGCIDIDQAARANHVVLDLLEVATSAH
ncbi:Gfo/Idh/MocA family oxidoreductase [Salinicola endophyticus]|uniref:Gfo/Idh/MocA family oxidoreductase n=1 Tax=Salinicola endophyticus TaxID=1949083 RepID=A0AB74UHF2_9GAMM